MPGQEVTVVAIITPKPGKIDEVIEVLTPLVEYVKANEPDVLQYEMFKQTDGADEAECLVYIEVFKNMKALAAHGKSEAYAMVQKTGAESQLLAAVPDIKILQHVGGFASR